MFSKYLNIYIFGFYFYDQLVFMIKGMSQNAGIPQHIVTILQISVLYVVEITHFAKSPYLLSVFVVYPAKN